MSPAPPHPAPVRPGATLLVTALTTALVTVAYTAPTASLAATAEAAHLGASGRTWILTGTLVGISALLLTAGSAADDHGRKRVFTVGVAVFAAAEALAALAPGGTVYLAARVLLGAGSAAILAPALGLISHAVPPGPARIRALGGWGAAVGLGIAVGPVYGALVEQWAGWRAVNGGLAVVSAALAAVASAVLTESRADRPRALDPYGVLTLAAGTSCLIAGLAQGRSGWGRPVVLVLLALGVLLLVLFAVVEARVREPMLDLALFRSPGFIAATGGAMFTGLSLVGFMSYLPALLQGVLGLSGLAAGGVLAIWSGLSVVAALQARRLAARLSATTQVALGLLACGAGEAGLYGLGPDSTWVRLAPGLVVAGIGSGVLNAALARLAVSSVPPHRAAMGSGANNTSRYLGSALGVAVTVAVAASSRPTGPGHEAAARALAAGTDRAVLVAAGLCLAGALLAVAARAAEARAGAEAEAEAPARERVAAG
ncbi:MFS transporter [Kitasatospora aureofaciens]|uniref:MFS transporter n=1 Tax=Kitasatospora aureofaciens TaxID=1894 RepID=UPI001C46410C|nr:MFS transporter [Kitasatospora aureofaciens]MBV6698183.1 MFS transporter [Kitasatospora aureofaciens]